MLVIYGREQRPGPRALGEGARAAGIRVAFKRPIYHKSDGVVYGTKWVVLDGLQGDNRTLIRETYRAVGVPIYIMELPRLRAGRASMFRGEPRSHGIYFDSLHDLPARMGNRAVTAGVIRDRRPETLLVCGQKPMDTAHGMDEKGCVRWAAETVELCRKQYQLPIVYRPHPQGVHRGVPQDEGYGADAISRPSSETLREAMSTAYAVVTYNSTSGIEAIDAGVPVFYTAPISECAYWQYAATLGSEPRILPSNERDVCLLRFAATQWTEQQLRDGTAARCLFQNSAWPEPEIVEMTDDELLADELSRLGLYEKQERLQGPANPPPAIRIVA